MKQQDKAAAAAASDDSAKLLRPRAAAGGARSSSPAASSGCLSVRVRGSSARPTFVPRAVACLVACVVAMSRAGGFTHASATRAQCTKTGQAHSVPAKAVDTARLDLIFVQINYEAEARCCVNSCGVCPRCCTVRVCLCTVRVKACACAACTGCFGDRSRPRHVWPPG
jgi:hypothetical protein